MRRILQGVSALVVAGGLMTGCASIEEIRQRNIEATYGDACGQVVDPAQHARCIQNRISESGPE